MNNIIWQKIKNNSLKSILRYFLDCLFKTVIMKFYYMDMIIDIDNVYNKVDNNLQVKELGFEDFSLNDDLAFNEKKMKIIKERLNDPSYVAYGIIENNVLIYSTWISYKKLGLPVKSDFYLESNEALLEDSFCHPNSRGKGLHGKMNLYRIMKIYESGKTKVVAIVLDNNLPALKVQVKSGFRSLGFFYAGKILGFPFSTLKNLKK